MQGTHLQSILIVGAPTDISTFRAKVVTELASVALWLQDATQQQPLGNLEKKGFNTHKF